jgi:hypothetical protein
MTEGDNDPHVIEQQCNTDRLANQNNNKRKSLIVGLLEIRKLGLVLIVNHMRCPFRDDQYTYFDPKVRFQISRNANIAIDISYDSCSMSV